MAFGNASAERAAIELTYEDTATVSRTTSQRGKNNISASSPSVIYDGIICALSYTGSDIENAIWEEFGTGEYALHGDGRKGGWVYKSKKDGKFYHTYGKTPRQPLTKAFQSVAPKIKKQLVNVIKQNLGG